MILLSKSGNRRWYLVISFRFEGAGPIRGTAVSSSSASQDRLLRLAIAVIRLSLSAVAIEMLVDLGVQDPFRQRLLQLVDQSILVEHIPSDRGRPVAGPASLSRSPYDAPSALIIMAWRARNSQQSPQNSRRHTGEIGSRTRCGRPKKQAHLSLGQDRFASRAAHDERARSTYLFGAVYPEHGTGAALVLPFCDAEAMQLHLGRDSHRSLRRRTHDPYPRSARWHSALQLQDSSSLSLLPVPPRAPELNSKRTSGSFMRQNWLSNRIFQILDDIVDHCC